MLISLLQFYFLICMIIKQSILVITLKASTTIVRSAVRAFTKKFRRPTNRFLQVSLYLLLLILIVDSYFPLFMILCVSPQKCARLIGKPLVGVGSSDIGMSTNIVPVTLQLALIGFFIIRNSFIFSDAG